MNTDNDIDAVFDNKYDEITETNLFLQSTTYQQNVMISSPEAYSNDSSIFVPMCLQMMGAAAAVFFYMDDSEDEVHTKRNQPSGCTIVCLDFAYFTSTCVFCIATLLSGNHDLFVILVKKLLHVQHFLNGNYHI
jgi:hypothetical protein